MWPANISSGWLCVCGVCRLLCYGEGLYLLLLKGIVVIPWDSTNCVDYAVESVCCGVETIHSRSAPLPLCGTSHFPSMLQGSYILAQHWLPCCHKLCEGELPQHSVGSGFTVCLNIGWHFCTYTTMPFESGYRKCPSHLDAYRMSLYLHRKKIWA